MGKDLPRAALCPLLGSNKILYGQQEGVKIGEDLDLFCSLKLEGAFSL